MSQVTIGTSWTELAADVSVLRIVQVFGDVDWVELEAAAEEPTVGSVVLVPGESIVTPMLGDLFSSGKLWGRSSGTATVRTA